MSRKKAIKQSKFNKKFQIASLLVVVFVVTIAVLLSQKLSFKQKEAEDFSGYCVPLQGGSFTLQDGGFKDYLNGYELNLSEFPEAVTSDPVCKKSSYYFDLIDSNKDQNLIGDALVYSSGFTILPEKAAAPNVDLVEFALSQINPEFKQLIEGAKKKYLSNIFYGKTNSGAPYIRIYEPAATYHVESYAYYININGRIILISLNPGSESSQTVLNKFEKVIKSFKINEDLTKQRKTILEQ